MTPPGLTRAASVGGTLIISRIYPVRGQCLLDHLLDLEPADRIRRFAGIVSDSAVAEYARGIDLEREVVLGCFTMSGGLVGAVHVGIGGGVADLGVSVHRSMRNRGVGTTLMRRALLEARNRNVAQAQSRCIPDNAPMMVVAVRLGMRIVNEDGDKVAVIDLPPPNWFSLMAGLVWRRNDAAFALGSAGCPGLLRDSA